MTDQTTTPELEDSTASNSTRLLCCEDWEPNMRKIDRFIVLQALRTSTHGYDGKPFIYCPWCGKKRAT